MAPANDDLYARDLTPEDFSRWARKARFFRALAITVSRTGYGEMTVADVLQHAGMSRRTFYELFENREDCFLQAFDAAVARMRLVVGAAYHGAEESAGLLERVELGLRAFLECCAAEPELAHMCVVEVLAAGPRARARRDAALLEFAHFIEFPRAEARGEAAPSLVSEAIAGGLYGILYTRIGRGETATLPDLHDELMDTGLRQLVERDDDG